MDDKVEDICWKFKVTKCVIFVGYFSVSLCFHLHSSFSCQQIVLVVLEQLEKYEVINLAKNNDHL
jgi:hypothetical protein